MLHRIYCGFYATKILLLCYIILGKIIFFIRDAAIDIDIITVSYFVLIQIASKFLI